MLFANLFKSDKRLGVGRGRKRKVTIKDVLENLDRVELSTANCTLIRDHLGNDKVEDYGQVDVCRVSDERLFVVDNGFFITTPSGMKLKSSVGDDNIAEIVSEDEAVEEEPVDEEDVDPDTVKADGEEEEEEEEGGGDAFSGGGGRRNQREPEPEPEEEALGIGQVIRLRFFFNRIPYEIDCQILDRFNPARYPNVDLTPKWGMGYRVRPLSDARKRDQRRYVRYTHRLGFGHLRMRSEIQFNVFAHKTDLEIPEKGALKQTISDEDFQRIAFGQQDVDELENAERIEDIVEFFMACMVQNPTERRQVYASKAYLDRLNRSSLEGLGYFNVVGSQQTTVLPKIFAKRQAKGETVLDKQLAGKSHAKRDARKMRAIEEMHDRFQMLTREQKIWQQRRMGKSVVGNFQNDIVLVGFSSPHGLPADGHATSRQLTMPVEVTDIGVENLTLKPIQFEDARSREIENKEWVRQEDGFQIDLLNFSTGGAQLRGGESAEGCEAFLQYLIGDGAEDMPFAERVEALQKHAILLNFYPVLNFSRSEISDYKPYLPYRIPVIARVARFSSMKNKENEEPVIASLGVEFLYNPIHDSYSRDRSEFDQWEQVTPYTESQHFIEIHKSLQLLFGFDRALEESLREDDRKTKEKDAEGDEEEEASDEASEEEEETAASAE
ncbi:MAG: hypothetical protein CME26_00125 [Gemmatimonadetes bacterium]|nr:hypothetical protein [Gemmatimonadota bacterium]|tara:strand:+ start:1206 stop:3206 length:2001 start_codon:yes stop_codon:yes gene_type:complete